VNASTNASSRSRDQLIARFAEACSADIRIVAAFVGGSVARGEADQYSDLDLYAVVSDEAADDVSSVRAAIVEQLGTPLFLEEWGREEPELFLIMADGTDVELFCTRESRIHDLQVGPLRPLLDRNGTLTNLDLPMRTPSRSDLTAELRHILAWFWHDVSHLIKALGRGQLWWAAGEVEALRGYCVNLIRIEQGLEAEDEPYWKIDAEMSTATLDPLRATFVPMDARALAQAGSDLVAYFGARGRPVADAHGIEYPDELDALMSGRLSALAGQL
jgi:predicted nucleotidyltransferase